MARALSRLCFILATHNIHKNSSDVRVELNMMVELISCLLVLEFSVEIRAPKSFI